MSGAEERMAAVLAEHQHFGVSCTLDGWAWRCKCGEKLADLGANESVIDHAVRVHEAEWHAHVAAALVEAGFGDVAAERERIAQAIEARAPEWGFADVARDAWIRAAETARNPDRTDPV